MQRLYQLFDTYFQQHGPRQAVLWSIILALFLGALDYFTGFEISFSFFYLIPIAIAAIYAGYRNGMIVTAMSVFIWAVSNRLAGESYSSEWIRYWNAGIRLVAFSAIAYILHQLNLSIQHQRLLARTDFLTGINNSREFYRLANIEVQRARQYRQPFGIAFLDLDNFKDVNDRYGHSAGDEVLRLVTQVVASVIRKGDLFARVGGDEFVLILPDTNSLTIRVVVEKVRRSIESELRAADRRVTVSMGAISYVYPPASVDEMIKKADQLMYEAKKQGKNGVLFKSL